MPPVFPLFPLPFAGFSDAGQAAEYFADGDFSGSPAEDFAQAAPDDSAYFADIDACEAAF